MSLRKDNWEYYDRLTPFYRRWRPGYPIALGDFVAQEFGWTTGALVADVACGTGQLSRRLLEQGCQVLGVEPSLGMLQAAREDLRAFPAFVGIEATAENTGLPDGQLDGIAVGNAFHWFNRERVLREWRRILKPRAPVLLAWNLEFAPPDDSFAEAFKNFWNRFLDPDANFGGTVLNPPPPFLQEFFIPESLKTQVFPQVQELPLEGLIGLARSFRKAPTEGSAELEALIGEAEKLWKTFQKQGVVTVQYHTSVFWGRL